MFRVTRFIYFLSYRNIHPDKGVQFCFTDIKNSFSVFFLSHWLISELFNLVVTRNLSLSFIVIHIHIQTDDYNYTDNYCHMTNNRSVPSTAHQVSTGLNSRQISSKLGTSEENELLIWYILWLNPFICLIIIQLVL